MVAFIYQKVPESLGGNSTLWKHVVKICLIVEAGQLVELTNNRRGVQVVVVMVVVVGG